ncbi:lysostaphin resistance A-like protein [Bacillus salipaludis]|uniref:CPBP family intramembrane glutamic endopeptidase n=1 Tax=Bacillus salipaludis TaxID=2547811 RepID=A0ABW8RK93_9BACI
MHWSKVVLHGLVLVILFLLAAIIVNPLTDGINNNSMRVTVKELIRIGLTVGMLKLYAQVFFMKSSAYFRIQKLYKIEKTWIFIGLAMPATVISFYMLTKFVVFEIQEQFYIASGFAFVISSFISACSAGVIEEILFRCYLFKLIEEKWNKIIAVCVTSILFGALHLLTINDLSLVDGSLVLIAGTLVGIMFSLIVYQTGNVWNAVVVHIIWNFFMNSKVVQFAPMADITHSSLVLFRFKSNSVWITGGTYGIEVALPVIFLYVLIIGGIAYGKIGVRSNSVKM